MSRKQLEEILLTLVNTLAEIKAANKVAREIRLRPCVFRWLNDEFRRGGFGPITPTPTSTGYSFNGYPIRIDERLNPPHGYWYWIETIDRLSPPGKG